MKIDKETIVKNHFWILLGIYAPAVLVALMLVLFGVSATVGEKASNLKKTKDDLSSKAKGDLKNDRWVKVLEGKEEKLQGQKNDMWRRVWEGQATIMTWPASLENEFPELKKAYFMDKLGTRLRDKYAHDANTYHAQLDGPRDGIVWIVDPVDSEGKGTVQYKDNNWRAVLMHVPSWPAQGVPESDDCWLAQEDIWVQRELLLCVKEANDFTANYKKLPNPPKPDKSKGEYDHQIFSNGIWKLDLIQTAREIRWQITNLTARRQPMAMFFKVKRVNVNVPDWIWVDGEPLPPYQSSKWGAQPVTSTGIVGLESVKEVLDWRSATVKRIDKFDLFHHSHRTNSKGLTTAPVKTDPNAPPDPMAGMMAGGPGGPGVPMGGPGGPGGPGAFDTEGQFLGGGMGAFGMAGQRSRMLVNKRRYIDWNDQVRRMAIGMVFIVDPSRIQDVLTALANSRLRFQITQVHWQHYTGSIKPIVDERNKRALVRTGSDSYPMAGVGRSWNMDTESYDSFSAGSFGQTPGIIPGITGNIDPGSMLNPAEETANVVELAIYGIASLYQKYPPRPPEPEAPAAGAEGAAPAAAATTPPAN